MERKKLTIRKLEARLEEGEEQLLVREGFELLTEPEKGYPIYGRKNEEHIEKLTYDRKNHTILTYHVIKRHKEE